MSVTLSLDCVLAVCDGGRGIMYVLLNLDCEIGKFFGAGGVGRMSARKEAS